MPSASDKALRQRKKAAKSETEEPPKKPKIPRKKKASTTTSGGLQYAAAFFLVFAILFFRDTLLDYIKLSLRLLWGLLVFYFNEFSGANEVELKEKLRRYPQREVDFSADVAKRDEVVKAFKGAWLSYERNAMGADEFHPISQEGTNLTTGGGIGYTIIDAIDTMKIMGLEPEFQRARKWVEEKLDFNQDGNYSTFECTIRVLGGLLSTYHLNGNDQLFLDKAVELADRLLPAFETQSGYPTNNVNLAKRHAVDNAEIPGTISTAEATSIQLEFKYLSHLTGNAVYWSRAEQIMWQVRENTMEHGLASVYLSYVTGEFLPSTIRLGSRADSHWEYLLKQYLQTNMKEGVYKIMYENAMNAIHNTLVTRSTRAQMTYIAEISPHDELKWLKQPRQEHLVCFFGGNLMLGAVTSGKSPNIASVSVPPRPGELTEQGERDWLTGLELVRTCVRTHKTTTGLAPEVVWFRVDGDGGDQKAEAPVDWYIRGAEKHLPVPYEARYLLRPETIESLFIAYRLTGDPQYRQSAWDIFQAIQEHCRVRTGGYAAIVNVDDLKRPAEQEDKTESYFLSETLKYLYLIFDDASTLSLDEYVLNTEAHPLPKFDPLWPAQWY